jgi:hypothetical protein
MCGFGSLERKGKSKGFSGSLDMQIQTQQMNKTHKLPYKSQMWQRKKGP